MTARILGALLAVLVCGATACHAHPHLYFDPELVSTEVRREDDALVARIVAVWDGTGMVDGVAGLHFHVRVENPGCVPFLVAPAEFELLDSESAVLGTTHGAGLPDAVQPKESVTVDLAFPVPATKLGLNLQGLTLRVRLDGGRWEWSAEFEHDYKSADPRWDSFTVCPASSTSRRATSPRGSVVLV